ncbi:hypothetical protein RHGRI_029863 [Rhododendron griersonianum]|uniref:Uncharacterized protein n=1 Tax=Rhododendron griersonianum TaxID=479676 RepID=A0AAV6IP27_9ERIC|nr:hypothetical protein RHGRI_029863 [Rhododendron griersonianum]
MRHPQKHSLSPKIMKINVFISMCLTLHYFRNVGSTNSRMNFTVEYLNYMMCFCRSLEKKEREEGFRNSNKTVKMQNHLAAKKSRMI